MNEIIYEYGNTIRLQCIFKDFNNDIVDPSSVKIIFYDHTHTKVSEYTSEVQHVELGTYYYDYTPNNNVIRDHIYYEWNGIIAGNVALSRGSIKTDFDS